MTLTLEKGELRCLIGPNGAGKTTLMDCITGKTRPDSGAVYLENRLYDPHQALGGADRPARHRAKVPAADGVSGAHASTRTASWRWPARRASSARCSRASRAAERTRIDEILELIGLKDQAKRQAGLLAHGQKQWLEIGMLLAQSPSVLLVDEPIAGMTHAETEQTAELLPAWPARTRSSWSSTTWSSSAASPGR